MTYSRLYLIKKQLAPTLLVLLAAIIFASGFLPQQVFAQSPGPSSPGPSSPEPEELGEFGLGILDEPPGVVKYNTAAGATADQPAIIYFLSRMIRLAAVLGGVWVVINIIIAAFFYITGSGDAGAHTKVRNLLTSSLVGLILIVGFYTMGAIIGLIFFGDATFILNPQLNP